MASELERKYKEHGRLSKQLFKEACRRHPDLEKMRSLLESGASPDYSSSWDGSTTLSRSINKHNVAAVKLLIEFKVDVNGRPLQYALNVGDLDILKLLTGAGAPVTYEDFSSALQSKNRSIIGHFLETSLGDLLDRKLDGTDIDWALFLAEQTGEAAIVRMVSDALEKRKAQNPDVVAAPPPMDPRDKRIADLERQVHELASSLTTVQRELADIKDPRPAVLDKKKLGSP